MKLTQEQLNILNHVVVDGQAWADHTIEEHMLAKVAKYKQPYLDAQGSGYKTRKERDDAQAKTEQDEYDNAPWNIKRKREYPVIGDQLDMLWHALDDGTLDKTSTFYTSLKATKDKYPKT